METDDKAEKKALTIPENPASDVGVAREALDGSPEASRRAALARLAAWTPPALYTLMISNRAQASSPPPP